MCLTCVRAYSFSQGVGLTLYPYDQGTYLNLVWADVHYRNKRCGIYHVSIPPMQSVKARHHTYTSNSLPQILAPTGHLTRWDCLCHECERMQAAGEGLGKEGTEGLQHLLANSSDISDKSHLELGQACSLLRPARAWNLGSLSFLCRDCLTLRLVFSCQFPFAFCEGKGQRTSWSPSAISSWHITGMHREKTVVIARCKLLSFPFLKASRCVSMRHD